MRREERNRSYELHKAEREYFDETVPTIDYRWEDDAYPVDDPKHEDYYELLADIYDLREW